MNTKELHGITSKESDGPTDEKASRWRKTPLSEEETHKVVSILKACRDHDLPRLSDLATSKHGLVEDEIRRTAWPVLLGYRRDREKNKVPWTSLPAHRDEEQVKLDVHRSFVYYPQGISSFMRSAAHPELSFPCRSV